MQMRFSPVFHFKRKPVYALPTWSGLAMFFLTGAALFFSVLHRAPVEQWISFLMILLTLLHLLDVNDPFRFISVDLLSFDPPYAGRPTSVPVLITNPGSLASEKLFLRFQDQGKWLEIPELLPQSSVQIHLTLFPLQKGKQLLPKIRIKMRPKSGLFQLWRVMESETPLYVLPEPVPHGVPFEAHQDAGENLDVSSIELIRDPRHLPKLDQKLFLKTGKPYYRTSDSGQVHEEITLRWKGLEKLSVDQKEEQFSSWIEAIEGHRSQFLFSVKVDTPFFTSTQNAASLNWTILKLNFAEWISHA
jgi:hypothetical protein